ncbi:MAG: HAD-IC family P-type ATPase [Bacilli bacterium]|nr:HAD-IC family P-type ATPase [Bacilli bacterium]
MKNWYNMDVDDVIDSLNSNYNGLSNIEAGDRLIKYGKNVLPKKKVDSFFLIFVKQMVEPMEILLMVAMLVSFLIGEVVDGFAILFIIIVDLLMGSFQEWKASRTALSLENLIKVKTKVLRDREMEVDSSELVVGDIVLLESGNKVSADMRILECSNLQVDESVLTGESLAVYKNSDVCDSDTVLANRFNMVFAGTNVLTGRAKAIVVGTGVNTEVGALACVVASAKESKSPLTIRMSKFTKQISLLVMLVAFIIAFVLIFKGASTGEIFLSVIALSVSAMPEGLSLALTMALTIASNRMSKKNVIVKKLNAAESLGSCTVIASDKTGTLTVNEQTAKRIVLPDDSCFNISGTGYNDLGNVTGDGDIDLAYFISKMGVLNNEAFMNKANDGFDFSGDSIDIAFLALGYKMNVNIDSCQVIDMIPYESENKYSAVFFSEGGNDFCSAKGSVEVILSFCKNMRVKNKIVPIDRDLLLSQNESLAREGYRVIALASRQIDKTKKIYDDTFLCGMTFLGLVAFIDPVRPLVKDSIRECRSAGIKVLMITGDHPLTAFSIAKDLDIVSNYDEVTTGDEVDKFYALGESDFDNFISGKRVFTRVTPLNKLYIVESLKRHGEFVAVTGDGVNDAPAIKSANIGIAMGSGTDVAKETASLIIMDDNFKSIVAGVKEGRNAYSNIRKVSYMLLSCGVAEVLFFVLSIICNLPMPLVAVQLLWLNIVTDGLQDFALSFEKSEKGIMNDNPRSPKESIFNRELLSEVLLSGFTIGVIVFLVWVYLIKFSNMDVFRARGYIMMLMVFMQNMHVLNCRSERQSMFNISLRSNLWVLFAIISAIGLQFIVSEVPGFSSILQTTGVPLLHVLLLFLLSTVIIVVMEIYKVIKYGKKL